MSGSAAEKRESGERDPSRMILIVDDEESIRNTLEGVFRDEGYLTESAPDAESALSLLDTLSPDLILLDIWMPGMDGLEALKRIKSIRPDIPVIMISGHATIATAVQSTKLGATDFIEKPLDLQSTLAAAQRALKGELAPSESRSRGEPVRSGESVVPGVALNPSKIAPVVFADGQKLRGRCRKQRTLSQGALLYGQGLHTGQKSGLTLEPLPADSGIHFADVSGNSIVPAHLNYVESTGFATTVRFGSVQAGTIEHVMSALHAYGISNLLIKCNGEVPVMDGSAREFCALIEEVGTEDQDSDWYEIEVRDTLRVGDDREWMQIEPADEFIIDYTLAYPEPLGEQRMVFTLNDAKTFTDEIAPARTFGFVRDIEWLQKQGLALGGRFDNFVLFGEEGPINCELRFSDEPVRHKILDLIGDLYLLGRPLKGKVTARMTGHSDNIALLGLLKAEMAKA